MCLFSVILEVVFTGWIYMKSKLTIREVDTPFGMQYSGCGEVRLYAKGWYAVRKNPVIPYADIHFNFKKVKFSYKNTFNVTNIVKQLYFSRAPFARAF